MQCNHKVNIKYELLEYRTTHSNSSCSNMKNVRHCKDNQKKKIVFRKQSKSFSFVFWGRAKGMRNEPWAFCVNWTSLSNSKNHKELFIYILAM